jgi:hypothetical protein
MKPRWRWAPVARRIEGGYKSPTMGRRSQTDGDPAAGGEGGGTRSTPAAITLPLEGLTRCAGPGCEEVFMQGHMGRPRRTCSALCRKRLQLAGRR